MEHTIRATDLARRLGDVLAKVRDRHDSFVVERHGTPVARVVPMAPSGGGATVAEALTTWCEGRGTDRTLADDLEKVGAVDCPPVNRWGA